MWLCYAVSRDSPRGRKGSRPDHGREAPAPGGRSAALDKTDQSPVTRLMPALGQRTLEQVTGAAVGTEDVAGGGDVEKHPGMHVPQRRGRRGAVQRQVGGSDVDGARIDGGRACLRGLAHRFFPFEPAALPLPPLPLPSLTNDSQSRCFFTLPFTTSKNSF